MASDDKLCRFTFTWKVEWSEYDKLGGPDDYRLRKYFLTAYNNVVFKWHVYLLENRIANDSTTNGLGLDFDDGPMETIKDVTIEAGLVKSDGSGIPSIPKITYREFKAEIGFSILSPFPSCINIFSFDNKNSAAFRTKYGLQDCDALIVKITMEIPFESFSYAPPIAISTPDHPVLAQLVNSYNSIQNPENVASYDAVLTSRDGVEFYCQKSIIGQTDPLKTMFSDPLASLEEQPTKPPPTSRRGTKRKAPTQSSTIEDPSTTEKKTRVYPFEEMPTSSLKAMIEYLYTGQSTLNELTVTEIIKVADAAEQYLLKPLKQMCAAQLWKCVTNEPESAFEIACFSDLHDECKYLKDRAFDVIVEKFPNLNVKTRSLPKRFGGMRSKELRDELVDYMEKRLRLDKIVRYV